MTTIHLSSFSGSLDCDALFIAFSNIVNTFFRIVENANAHHWDDVRVIEVRRRLNLLAEALHVSLTLALGIHRLPLA
jgi:hypothetical protein